MYTVIVYTVCGIHAIKLLFPEKECNNVLCMDSV